MVIMSRNIIKALTISAIMVVFFVLNIMIIKPISALNRQEDNEYLYHFQVLVDSDARDEGNDTFIQELKSKGLKNKAFVELVEVKKGDKKEDIIQQGIYAKVDGIACTMDSKKMGNSMYNKAKSKNVALFNYGMDNYSYDKLISIGPDEYDLGIVAAEQMCNITEKEDKILVVYNSSNDKNKSINKNIEKGFKKGISNNKYKKSNFKYVNVKEDKFGIRNNILDILKDNKKCAGIVVFDMDYASIIGDIVENKEISFDTTKNIVAYGENEDNLGYLRKGIFDRVLTYDGKEMADILISAMIESKLEIEARNYITNLEVIQFDKNKFDRKVFNTESSK